MKKVINILITLFSIAIFIPFLIASADNELNEFANPEIKSDDLVILQVSNIIKTRELDLVKSIFINVMDKYDASLIINDFEGNNFNKYIHNYSYYSDNNISEDVEVNLLRKGSTFRVSDFEKITDIDLIAGELSILCKDNCDLIIGDLSSQLLISITEKTAYLGSMNLMIVLVPITVGFLMLLSIFIIFEMYKKYQLFSIRKLHGFSMSKILILEVVPIIMSQLLVMSTTLIVLTAIFTNDYISYPYEFTVQALKLILFLTLITAIVICVPILLFTKVNFIDYLKGRTQSKFFLHFNQIILSLILLVSVVLINLFSSTLISYYTRYRNSEEWQRMNDFYIVPTYGANSNIIDDPEFRKITVEAFKSLNNKGSIYADFNDFYHLQHWPDDHHSILPIAYVNANYLDFHELKDQNSNSLSIDNEDTAITVLLPDDKSISEDLVRDAYDIWYKEYDFEIDLKLIYYDSTQKLFTYNSEIVNNFSNYVENIPLHVVTNKNGVFTDYDRIIGYSNNPFKIKGDSIEDVANTLNMLGYNEEVFSGFRLDIMPANDDISKLNQIEISIIVVLIMAFIINLVMINQSINLSLNSFLSINQKEIAVKRMYGYPVLKVFKDYFKISSAYILINLSIVFLISRSVKTSLQFLLFSMGTITIFLIFKLKRVYNSSLANIFKGRDI